ncbi:MAG: hypothetical protein ACOC6C_06135 [Verrucomicrobiota bacterium]
MRINLSHCALIIGSLMILLSGSALIWPASARKIARGFSRNTAAAWTLVIIDMVWSAWLVHNEPMPRFEQYKSWLFILTPGLIVMIIFLMEELLAARALGGLMLLAASPILTAVRFNDSSWRIFMTLIGYTMVLAGIMLVLSPFRLRKGAEWLSVSRFRWQAASIAVLLIGATALLSGVFAY